jgi:hypothetical protein
MNVSDKVVSAAVNSTAIASVKPAEKKDETATAVPTTGADTVSISPQARAMSEAMTDNPGDWPSPPGRP